MFHRQLFKIMGTLQMLSVLLLLSGCGSSRPEIQKQTRFLMDTYVTIQIPGGPENLEIIGRAMEGIEAVEKKFNIFEEGNPLFQFNHEGTLIDDPEILNLIRIAMDVGEQTEGAFDITIYPLIEKWGFFNDVPAAVPDSAIIQNLLNHVGLNHLKLDSAGLTKRDASAEIDLGGIAKGYAVMKAVEIIQDAGVSSALVDAGGDIYALGELNGKPWKIGIRNPRGEGVIGAFDISDLAVVTSGDYERFFEENGIRYHHILDPQTGYPARELASVTIITKDATLADALSTAVFVMGKEKGLAFLKKSGLAEAILITDDGQMFTTEGLN